MDFRRQKKRAPHTVQCFLLPNGRCCIHFQCLRVSLRLPDGRTTEKDTAVVWLFVCAVSEKTETFGGAWNQMWSREREGPTHVASFVLSLTLLTVPPSTRYRLSQLETKKCRLSWLIDCSFVEKAREKGEEERLSLPLSSSLCRPRGRWGERRGREGLLLPDRVVSLGNLGTRLATRSNHPLN